jgi:hypothetical protein
MTERPILFSAPMMRAILSGEKTQTRRIVKPQPQANTVTWGCTAGQGFGFSFGGGDRIRCKFGEVGDRLWVRETWRPQVIDADGQVRITCVDSCRDVYPPEDWRIPKSAERGNVPSIFMPRWASRITLEITSVRVERLNEISEEDAMAEGMRLLNGRYTFNDGLWEERTAIDAFKALWHKINGEQSWLANPWVWVVGFKVIA